MSGRIVGEVLDYAPEDLTPAQMLVLLALAEDARDSDRQARHNSSAADLARRTRRPSGTVRNILAQLVARGLIRPVHDRVHKGGLHQEYVLAKLSQAHRFATLNGQPRRPE